MPKKSDRQKPGASAARALALEADDERGLAMRLLMNHPKDVIAAMFAAAAAIAIISNALMMQAGRHPSPMFGAAPAPVPAAAAAAVVGVLPRPRPSEAAPRLAEPRAGELKPLEPRLDSRAPEPRSADLFASPTKVTAAAPAPAPAPAAAAPAAAQPRPPAPVPVSTRSDPLGDLIDSSRRIAAVQRALTDYGYGQLKATGVAGSDTQAAIQRFERDRRMPVTGQVSDRLVKELSAMTGRPID